MASVGTDAEGQVKFLVNCIKHSQSGRVDFEAVATECNIVSKAAAAKRFERLLKANGMKTSDLQKGGSVGGSPGPSVSTPASKSKATPKGKGKRTALPESPISPTKNTKRSKLADHPAVTAYSNEDDEEDENAFKVKDETQPEGAAGASTGSYYNTPRFRDADDDDDLQLLYIVEKTNGCPIRGSSESRNAAKGNECAKI
ncbi:hypothetical protein CCHL11_01483 [Colletotrichum chlorophyti]|uniref:Myb-like DNA-binding domain-containing protein n=1 Tax=Colletotrichum chlorophyti TaxID=708187 RepID=A0A1Q8RXX6_9PEZI|nr:hypothetical protein CCHL11_01483 [Colletotrichum chlorophyti]